VNRTYRTLIPVVLIAAAAGAYWMFLLAPKRKDAADLQQKVSIAQAQVTQTQQMIAGYEKSREQYKDNFQTLVRLGKAVPSDDDTRSLLVQLDATAKRAGVAFGNIDLLSSAGGSVATVTPTPGTPVVPGAVNAGSFSQMPFSFTFTGDYATLSNFVGRVNRFVTLKGDQVEVNGRLLRIDSIALSTGPTGWPAIQAQIGASTYIVPETGANAQGPQGTTPPAAGSTTTSSASTTTTSGSTSTTSDLAPQSR